MSEIEHTTATSDPVVAETDLELGCIVHSNSHMDYVSEVFRERDRENPPGKRDHRFGQPVYTRQNVDGETYVIVGVVYNTQLVDPDQGRSGPRLAADMQDMFNPGYVQDKQTLLGVGLLGYALLAPCEERDGWSFAEVSHDMPPWTLDVDDIVYKLEPDGVRAFHAADGSPKLGYYQRLLDVAGEFGSEVTLALIDQLREAATDTAVLDVIERNVRWQASEDRGVTR